MNLTKGRCLIVILFIVLSLSGMVFGIFYKISPSNAVRLSKFQSELEKKEAAAFKTLDDLSAIVKVSPPDSLVNYFFADDEISYYVLEDDELVFWSDNQLDISSISTAEFTDWHYIQLPNAYCVIVSRSVGNIDFAALITIKYDYPYENDKLINRFAKGFHMDKRVEIKQGSMSDDYPVFCKKGHYLFSLVEPEVPLYNEAWSLAAAAAFLLAFFTLFLIYARLPLFIGKKNLSLKAFCILFLTAGTVILLLLYFNIPSALFEHKHFTPFYYAHGPFFSSICQLTIFTGFIAASVCLFYFYVRLGHLPLSSRLLLLLVYPVYFLSLYAVLRSLVFHSCIQLNILHSSDFSVVGVWAHFLLLVWGIGLALIFYKVHNYFAVNGKLRQSLYVDILLLMLLAAACLLSPQLKIPLAAFPYLLLTIGFYAAYHFKTIKYGYLYLLFWGVIYAVFIAVNLLELNIQKNRGKYRVLAQNVYINGNVENDRIADILLEELDTQLSSDPKIGGLIVKPDSMEAAKEYLDKTYFRGFWNKYDIQLNAAPFYSDLFTEYADYIRLVGTKVGGTHFYSVPTTQNAMTYIGVFLLEDERHDSLYYFMEFYPRREYKSYSFPDLLIPSSADIHKQLNVSVAKYDNHYLTYSSGMVDYPFDSFWIPEFESDYTTLLYEDRWHYIYRPNDETYIVVSKQSRNEFVSYIQFFIYLALVYFMICWLMVRLYQFFYNKDEFRMRLAARFQYTFVSLLIISFVAIFYVSIDFIKQRYQDQQIENLDSKRKYIQNALQNMYYWNQELDMHNASSLNFDLQDLSYTYQTDIHVFDNNGVLVGSSQPLIFYRNLISNRIAPEPYFSLNPNIEQYEQIGELDYLVAYTDFYNGDYLQIGYIAVPQFLSQENMRAEIENFSSVIIHIYFVIIILAIFLTVFVGKRLSAPLNMLEGKLKEMRIGRRNEKIDYRQNDEIGQLVSQYNRTVDELEQSVKLLAKSERESAWKSMARQVAHEINNPLTPMKLSIQQLRRRKKMDDEGFDEYFEKSTAMLIEQIDNLSRIAGTFSDFARMPEAKFSQVDLSAVLQSVVGLFTNNNEKIEIKYTGQERSVFIYADSEQLIQVFNNLIKNAIQAIPKDRQGIIDVKLEQFKEKVVVRIADNGSGVPEEIRDKMFVPNFTTKAQGMGLGLAISKNIIEQLGGTIRFETKENEGSVFIIEIPKAV